MTKKRKNQPKVTSLPQLAALVVILGVGGLGLASHAVADLSVHHSSYSPSRPITLGVAVTPTPVPPTPAATPAPAPVKAKAKTATRRVAVAPKVLPAVAPAPDSAVSHLVPVAPAPSPSDTPTPGLGSGTAPTPTPVTTPTSYYSSNWSGYMSPAGNFTGISGSWTVPNVHGNGAVTTGDAAWIGIGGVTSSDLIQVGTDDTVTRDGHVSTIAFYEMLPESETPIPSMSVSPGDVMSADIHQVGGQWLITINDVTQHETFSVTVTYNSTLSTAEWIQEDPSYSSGGLVPFDVFGSVNFTDSLATSGGVTQNLVSSGAQKIIMVNGRGRAIATPSAIGADAQSFTVTGS